MAPRHQPNFMSRRPKALTLTLTLAAAAVVAAAVLVPGAAAAPANCTKTLPGTPQKQDQVVEWGKTCNEARNWECDDCDLWRDFSRNAFKNGTKFVYSSGEKYRGKILPGAPVTGIESIVLGSSRDPADAATYFLWKQALEDAKKGGKIPKVTQPIPTPVVYLNSLTARTRHQFHAHVGKPQNNDFFKCAQSVINNPPTPALKWSQNITIAGCAPNLQAGNYPFSMIGTQVGPNDVNRAIRSGFNQVVGNGSNLLTDSSGLHAGVLVMPAKNSNNLLVFIVVGSSDYHIFGDQPRHK